VFLFKSFYPFDSEKFTAFASSNPDDHNPERESLRGYSVAVRKRISEVPSNLSIRYAEPHR
jgi:hypothetical protein